MPYFYIVDYFFSCKDEVDEDRFCSPPTPTNVSFRNNVIPLFNQNCNAVGCHAGILTQGNINLQDTAAYSQLMKPGKGYIDLLNPGNSGLYLSMTNSKPIMPPSGKLDHCQTDIILKWIEQGALNN